MERLKSESKPVQKQRITPAAAEPLAPWTPVCVALIAFLLPAGGAVLTVRNMARLQQIDQTRVRELVAAAIGVFAIGFTALLVLAQPNPAKPEALSTNASAVLSLGTAVASYVVQRSPYMAWRRVHERQRTGGWLRALWLAVLFTLVTLAVVLVLRLAIAVFAAIAGLGAGQL